jgi:glycosyltransferase involved in cell wall biosynthesis
VRVLRVKIYLSANKGVGNRSLNYFSCLLSAAAFCRLVKDVDLVVSTSPQFFCGLSGYFVSRRLGCPWVVEIRDLWPESIHAVGAVRGRGVIRLLERIELFLYQKPHHIVALTPAFKRHMVAKGIPPGKIDIVTNGTDLEQFSPLPKRNGFRERHGLNGKFVAAYGPRGTPLQLCNSYGPRGTLLQLCNSVFMGRIMTAAGGVHAGDHAGAERILAQIEGRPIGFIGSIYLWDHHSKPKPLIVHIRSGACFFHY